MMGRIVIACLACAMVAACAGGEPNLMRLRSDSRSPDEFAILPTKPLDITQAVNQGPLSVAALPVPTPGGTNRTDPTPAADAIAALGGRAGSGVAGDGALVAQTTRFGVDPTIRQDLAQSDAEFRSRNRGRVLERVFNVNSYYRVYEPHSLDQRTELERWRRAGARTPAVPPAAP